MKNCTICGKLIKDTRAAMANHYRWEHKNSDKKYTCICGKTFTDNCGFSMHKKYCDGTGTAIYKRNKNWMPWKICPKCGYTIGHHRKHHFDNCDGLGPRRVRPKIFRQHYHKGKTFDEIYGVDRANDIKAKLSAKSSGKAATKEAEILRKQRISETMKKNKRSGGYRKNSGRGKMGYYAGIWCQSTWELAWIIYYLEHNIKFERNHIGFEYEYLGEKHKFYPDFILEDGTYIEIKGRRSFYKLDDINKQKILSFANKLKIYYESDMRVILKYVIDKYGQDFVRLYENKDCLSR